MKYTLGKEERLKSRKLIKKLYEEGKSVTCFPLRMVYLQTEHTSNFPAQAGISVSKKNFKRAVDRNRIKRLVRESYRLQKEIVYNNINQPYIYMISYVGKKEWKYNMLFGKMNKLLTLFVETEKICSSNSKYDAENESIRL